MATAADANVLRVTAADYTFDAPDQIQGGLTTIRLLTNNPKKIVGLGGYGLSVIDRVAIEMDPVDDNVEYLRTKRDKMGHVLHHQDLRFEEGAEPPPQDGGGER